MYASSCTHSTQQNRKTAAGETKNQPKPNKSCTTTPLNTLQSQHCSTQQKASKLTATPSVHSLNNKDTSSKQKPIEAPILQNLPQPN